MAEDDPIHYHVVCAPDGCSFEIRPRSNNKGIKPIKVESLHLSCQSDVGPCGGRPWENKRYGGIIIYSLGTLEKNIRESKGLRIKPGYVYIKDCKNMSCRISDEGIVHGCLTRVLTGHQPKELVKAGGLLSGFSIDPNGNLVFISASANAACGNYKCTKQSVMGKEEQKALKNAVRMWRSGEARGQNIPVERLALRCTDPEDGSGSSYGNTSDSNAVGEMTGLPQYNEIVETTAKNYPTRLIVVQFYADWCGPCHDIAPVVEELARTVKSVRFYKINVEKDDSVTDELRISSVPSFVFIKGGEMVTKLEGATEEELRMNVKKFQ